MSHPDFKHLLIHGLWTAFRWPFFVWLAFMLLKTGLAPLVRAIGRTFNR